VNATRTQSSNLVRVTEKFWFGKVSDKVDADTLYLADMFESENIYYLFHYQTFLSQVLAWAKMSGFDVVHWTALSFNNKHLYVCKWSTKPTFFLLPNIHRVVFYCHVKNDRTFSFPEFTSK
jgi:hypothetical protein